MSHNENYIYVLLTNTGTLFTHAIKQFTRAPYNHSSISLDPHLNEVYSFGRKKAYNPITAGFVKEDLYHGTFSYFPKTTCALFKIPVTENQLLTIKSNIEFFSHNKHIFRYNLIGLFGIPLNLSYNRKNSYFCSEFVAEILTNSNVLDIPKETCLITPDELRSYFKEYLVYEGPLFEYPLIDKKSLQFKKYRNHLPFYSSFF